jgi:hypothetical protein
MTVSARNFIADDIKEMHLLVDPDGIKEWAVRYLWIQHREHNVEFVTNYFTNGNNKGLNVRSRTEHLGETWTNHNKIFDESAANGNLVWRVKSYNSISQSIDYIEVWRSTELLNNIFDKNPMLSNGERWTTEQKNELGKGIYDSGFDVRHLRPFADISKKQAIEYYNAFVVRYKNRDNCIINTRYNPELNPL